MKKMFFVLMVFSVVFLFCSCDKNNPDMSYVSRFDDVNTITLTDDVIKVNDKEISTYGDVFLSDDIIYYEQKETYESTNPYGEGTIDDSHSYDEAKEHKVINITKSGAYRISGNLSKGQIRVDLGKDAKNDPQSVVELILDNADITCEVAPAILFLNVYECDTKKSQDASFNVDTKDAGAVLVLKDGTKNNINGSYVAKIYKDKEGEKKLWKQDGAIYSYMSLNVEGKGELNLIADNEGLNSERHISINNGDINIYSDNDGINTNEDGISVTTINGGNVNIVAGLGKEGDAIDSNGWIVVNGGNLYLKANPISDSGLDSDMGTYINGGNVVSTASMMDNPHKDSKSVVLKLGFHKPQKEDFEICVKTKDEKEVFSYKSKKSSFTDGKMRDFSFLLISSPDFKEGKDYFIYVNGVKQGHIKGSFNQKPPLPSDFKKQSPPDIKDGKNPPQMPHGDMPKFPDGKFSMIAPHMMEAEIDYDKLTETFSIKNKTNTFTLVTALS